jgi:5'-phosphate synthase pdxT subunit
VVRDADPLTIGVLALQGAFAKHIAMVRSLGSKAFEVRKPSELALCDALIMPGGESTTMMKQMKFIGMVEPLIEFAERKPVFGTCAGLILMSSEILADSLEPLHLLQLSVERNAFGSQAESFKTDLTVIFERGKKEQAAAIFIRAPRIRAIGSGVSVLAFYEDEAVLVQQGLHLGATFHPELTHNTGIHAHFLALAKKAKS